MDYGKEVEIIYRNGLRTALGVRSNVNNEILYIESSKYPLKCRIMKEQLKFWLSLQDYCEQSPESALKHFLDVANELQIPYVKWYQLLETTYRSPKNCKGTLKAEYRMQWRRDFDGAVDIDSKLGTYTQVNPTLFRPKYINEIMFETVRLLLARFRCGSHSLSVKKGRYSNVPQEE